MHGMSFFMFLCRGCNMIFVSLPSNWCLPSCFPLLAIVCVAYLLQTVSMQNLLRFFVKGPQQPFYWWILLTGFVLGGYLCKNARLLATPQPKCEMTTWLGIKATSTLVSNHQKKMYRTFSLKKKNLYFTRKRYHIVPKCIQQIHNNGWPKLKIKINKVHSPE